MKCVWLGLMMSAVPPFLSVALAADIEARQGDEARPVVTVTVTGTGQASNGTVTAYVSGEGDGTDYAFVSDAGTEDEAISDGRSDGKRKVIRLAKVGPGDDESGGWLGVSIDNVSESLSTQLNLNGRGLVIQNIVTDSPADKAGLQVHDILLSVDGQEVGKDIGAAVQAIRKHNPGEVVNLLILRNGVNLPVAVTLGSRAELGGPQIMWKQGDAGSAIIEDQVQTRGRFMFKDEDGNWVMKDLGTLDDDLDGLPADVRMHLPRSGTRTVTVQRLADDNTTIRVNVKQDGSSISISQDDNGPITVERKDAQNNETTVTYQTADELKASDPEAYELFNKSGDVKTFTFKLDGAGGTPGALDFDWNFQFDGDDLDVEGLHEDLMGKLQAQIEASVGAGREAFEKQMAEAHRLMEQMHGKGGPGGHAFAFRPFGMMGKQIGRAHV